MSFDTFYYTGITLLAIFWNLWQMKPYIEKYYEAQRFTQRRAETLQFYSGLEKKAKMDNLPIFKVK